MTRDDIRKLIGGYATGTLTESERKLLFEAALDDQELFDELAREQALKEMLDEPGAKTRLISKLADVQPKLAWWRHPVAWSVTALIAASVVTIVWLKPGRPEMNKPVEVAEVRPAPMAAPAPVPAPEAKPANQPVKPAASAPALARLEKRAEARRDVSAPAAPAEVAAQNTVHSEAVKQAEAAKQAKEVDAREKDTDQKADAEQKSKKTEQLAAAGRQFAEPPPSPASQSPASAQAASSQSAGIQTANGRASVEVSQVQVAPQAPAFQPSSGFGGGARAGALAKRSAARTRFGFDYSLQADRHLVIKAAAAGYLSVAAQSTIFPAAGDGHVAAGSTTRVAIPADVHSLVIVFSASPQTTQTVLADAVSSVRDSRAGTVEDPSPSANSKLVIQLKIQP